MKTDFIPMKDVYVAHRWRALLFMYPIFLFSSLFSRYLVGTIFSRPDPFSILDEVIYAALVLGILVLFLSTPLIKQSDIEVSRTGVVGPISRGMFKQAQRKRLAIEEIDLSRSKCRFLRAYLRAYDGRKLLVAAPFLGMDQTRDLFSDIQNIQSQRIAD